jgi:quercetin dioxygenase-like cupin family protein
LNFAAFSSINLGRDPTGIFRDKVTGGLTTFNVILKEDSVAQQVSNMKDMVAYQAGSIVSKEIVKRPTGTVTLFAFDRDQGLSEHTAPFDALVQIVEGEAEIIISGESHLLNEGEMIIMPAGKPHALKALKKFKMMLVMIKS